MTDTERLDWIEKNGWDLTYFGVNSPRFRIKNDRLRKLQYGDSLREAIDRAIAEEKNK